MYLTQHKSLHKYIHCLTAYMYVCQKTFDCMLSYSGICGGEHVLRASRVTENVILDRSQSAYYGVVRRQCFCRCIENACSLRRCLASEDAEFSLYGSVC